MLDAFFIDKVYTCLESKKKKIPNLLFLSLNDTNYPWNMTGRRKVQSHFYRMKFIRE